MNKFIINELEPTYKEKLIKKFKDTDVINELVMLEVSYYDFNDNIQVGKIVCNKKISNTLIEIFRELFNNKYQIEKIKLIDEYDFDDVKSMSDNNTSSFNYRKVMNEDRLSRHAYGMAIDINPFYNPYIKKEGNKINIYPKESLIYANRNKSFKHKLDKDDLCCKLFIKYGFEWAGNWEYPDYQHFQK